tara:strand:- start:1076 stop:1276 length:201 start_codon:yes stop_codon:yes gene_type:complete
MIPSERLKKGIKKLNLDEDFKSLIEYLIKHRLDILEELEDANNEIHVHKLQGYSQALRDLIRMCSK